jgi:hypothetical protein
MIHPLRIELVCGDARVKQPTPLVLYTGELISPIPDGYTCWCFMCPHLKSQICDGDCEVYPSNTTYLNCTQEIVDDMYAVDNI